MKKSGLLFPFTLVAGVVAAIAGAVVFAKNDKVQKFVKENSFKLLHEVKIGVGKAQTKLAESNADKNDKFVSFLTKTLSDISASLEKTDKGSVDSTFDNLASNINKALEKFEEVKGTQIDPAVKSAIDSLKEAKDKISTRVKNSAQEKSL